MREKETKEFPGGDGSRIQRKRSHRGVNEEEITVKLVRHDVWELEEPMVKKMHQFLLNVLGHSHKLALIENRCSY